VEAPVLGTANFEFSGEGRRKSEETEVAELESKVGQQADVECRHANGVGIRGVINAVSASLWDHSERAENFSACSESLRL